MSESIHSDQTREMHILNYNFERYRDGTEIRVEFSLEEHVFGFTVSKESALDMARALIDVAVRAENPQ